MPRKDRTWERRTSGSEAGSSRTLASQDQGYGNLMLTGKMQADFVGEAPEGFVPIHGGWGGMGMTHIRLAKASEDVLAGALHAAWQFRVEKNRRAKHKTKKRAPCRRT